MFHYKKLFIVVVFCFVVLSGCGNNDEVSTQTEDEPVDLTFYFPVAVGGDLANLLQELVNEFMEEHPEIEIEAVYTGSYQDTLARAQTAVQGGDPPDLAILSASELYTLMDMDAITPLDELIEGEGEGYLDDFYDGFLENSQAYDQTWSISFQRSTPILYYNKDMFEEAGLDPESPPENWDELLEYAEKLTERGPDGSISTYGIEIPSSGFAYWLFQQFALQNSEQNLMDGNGAEVYFDTPENVEALEFFVDLSREHEVMPRNIIDWATTPSSFLDQQTAMMYHTTGNLTSVSEDSNFELGIAPLPGNVRNAVPTGGGNFYIFNNIEPENQQAAWQFISWMTEPERLAQWSIDTGYIAPRSSSYETDVMQEYIEEFPEATIARDQLDYAYAELSTHNNGRVYQAIEDNLQSAITGDISPAEALKRAQEEAEQALEPFN